MKTIMANYTIEYVLHNIYIQHQEQILNCRVKLYTQEQTKLTKQMKQVTKHKTIIIKRVLR